ncbi:MAG: hypothetical protein E7522_09200 [Ruminococcaceae bacterium]|nr:hypothetical protein [Oscillospiraceae bacterium]
MFKKLLKLAQKDLYVQAVSVFAILLSITVVAVAYIKTANNEKKIDNTNTSYNYQTLPPQNNTFSTNSAVVLPMDTTLPENVTGGWQNNPVTQAQQQPQQNNSVYSWSTEQIVSKMTTAINQTKGYKNNLAVHHSESFVANITECTGGAIGQRVANSLVSAVVKPTDQTLNFSNGTAVTAEGETTQILLPKNSQFTLSPAGVKTAKAYQEGDKTVLVVTLIQENVDKDTIPYHNSRGVGYLDPNSVDLMGMTITSGEIQYLGSSIMVKINQAGYVTYAKYTIPLHVYGEGAKGSLSGYAVFDGAQTEIWELPL